MDDAGNFYHNVDIVRKLRGFSHEQLAEKSGVSRGTLFYSKKNKGSISLANAESVAKALNVPLAVLIGPLLPDKDTDLPVDQIANILKSFSDEEGSELLSTLANVSPETRRLLVQLFASLASEAPVEPK